MAFVVQIKPEVLEWIREEFPIGCAVEVVSLTTIHENIHAGIRGKVLEVTDAGTIKCEFDNGVVAELLHGFDTITRLT